MREVIAIMGPLALLIGMGVLVRAKELAAESTLRDTGRLIGDVLIPCVIFRTILNLELRREHFQLTAFFFLFLVLLLILSALIYRLFHVKRLFFIFSHSAFAFGLMAIPLFSTVYGVENMDYLVAMGVGHELFFSLVYLPCVELVFRKKPLFEKGWGGRLFTPLLCLVLLGLVLNLTGGGDLLAGTLPGMVLLKTVDSLASITTVLTMVVIGYNLHFENLALLRESAGIVLVRYLLAFGVGYPLKWLVLEPLVGASENLDRAFILLISQFGSTVLIMMIGKYCSKEDMEVASNAFAINVLVGFLIAILYFWLHPAIG